MQFLVKEHLQEYTEYATQRSAVLRPVIILLLFLLGKTEWNTSCCQVTEARVYCMLDDIILFDRVELILFLGIGCKSGYVDGGSHSALV